MSRSGSINKSRKRRCCAEDGAESLVGKIFIDFKKAIMVLMGAYPQYVV